MFSDREEKSYQIIGMVSVMVIFFSHKDGIFKENFFLKDLKDSSISYKSVSNLSFRDHDIEKLVDFFSLVER